MPLKASDLNESQKQAILDHIRGQMDEMQYINLRDALGEDRLIDAILQQASEPDRPVSKGTSGSLRVGIQWVFYIALFLALLAGIAFPDGSAFEKVSEIYDSVYGIAFGCAVVLFFVIWIISLFTKSGGVEWGTIFFVAFAITLIIALLGALVTNIAQHGFIVVGVVIIGFIYFYLAGFIFGIPIGRYLAGSAHWLKKTLMGILGLGIMGGLLYGGWSLILLIFQKK